MKTNAQMTLALASRTLGFVLRIVRRLDLAYASPNVTTIATVLPTTWWTTCAAALLAPRSHAKNTLATTGVVFAGLE